MKRKNKLSALIFYIILGATVGAVLVLLQSNHSKVETGETTSYEPKFQHDGNLVFIAGNDTLATIEVEIVNKPDAIVQGLMYRRKMQDNRGMFFDFPNVQKRYFWMKNTYIPLDIIFVDSQNKIVNIAENTEPFSEERIESVFPAKYVVEVNAGFCKKFKIAIGHKIDIFFFND